MPKIDRKNTKKLIEKTRNLPETICGIISTKSGNKLYKNIDYKNLKNRLIYEMDALTKYSSDHILGKLFRYLDALNKITIQGKCLGRNTPVLMFDGTIKMVQDIIIGDVLMGDDNVSRNVLSVCTGTGKLYKINQEYGDQYTTTKEHILSLKLNGSWIIKTGTNKTKITWSDGYTVMFGNENLSDINSDKIDISVEKYINTPNFQNYSFGYKTCVEFKDLPIKVDPYFIGFWIGDSNNENTKLRNNKDINIYFLIYIKNMRSYVKYNTNELLYEEDVNGNREIQLFTHLKNYDLINNKYIPIYYKTNTIEVRLKLLAGIIDNAIHADIKNSVKISVRWQELANDIVFLCRSLGFVSTMETIAAESLRKNHTRHEYYVVNIFGKLNMIPSRMFFNESFEKQDLTYKIEITDDTEGEYYGFEIDRNGRFLLGDFTVCHNINLVSHQFLN